MRGWKAAATVVAALASATSCSPPDEAVPARARIEAALVAMGGVEALERAGTIEWVSEGTLDKLGEGQSHTPGASSAGPLRDVVAFDLARGYVTREYREDRYDGTFEWLRETYAGPDEHRIVLPDLGFAIPFRSERYRSERRRLTRRIPPLLLQEVLESAREPEESGRRGDTVRVLGWLADDAPVTLLFSVESSHLLGFDVEAEIEARGVRRVSWRYGDYRAVEALGVWPGRTVVTVGDRPYVDVRTTRVAPSGPDSLFEVPDGLRLLEERVLPPRDDDATTGATASAPPLTVDTISPGVWLVPNVRGGFRHLVVDLPDEVVVVDAPAGFPLLGEVPPGRTDPAPNMSWNSERLVDLVRVLAPGRAITLVLTHGHEDHMGGVRAFAHAGARVVTVPSVVPAIRELLAADLGGRPDRLSAEPVDPTAIQVHTVTDRHVLGSGARTVEILDVGPNPHHNGMLVVHVPSEDLLFVADLMTGEPVDEYPRASHAPLDRWTVGWLDRVGLRPGRIHTMHGNVTIVAEHLEAARRTTS